jgi:hypothetical protein
MRKRFTNAIAFLIAAGFALPTATRLAAQPVGPPSPGS